MLVIECLSVSRMVPVLRRTTVNKTDMIRQSNVKHTSLKKNFKKTIITLWGENMDAMKYLNKQMNE